MTAQYSYTVIKKLQVQRGDLEKLYILKIVLKTGSTENTEPGYLQMQKEYTKNLGKISQQITDRQCYIY